MADIKPQMRPFLLMRVLWKSYRFSIDASLDVMLCVTNVPDDAAYKPLAASTGARKTFTHVCACMQATDVEAELAASRCECDALRTRVAGLEKEAAKAAAEAAAAQAQAERSHAAAAAASVEARAPPCLPSCLTSLSPAAAFGALLQK